MSFNNLHVEFYRRVARTLLLSVELSSRGAGPLLTSKIVDNPLLKTVSTSCTILPAPFKERRPKLSFVGATMLTQGFLSPDLNPSYATKIAIDGTNQNVAMSAAF